MDEIDIFELSIDEMNDKDGVEAISFVKSPAIEENFVALSDFRYEFKAVDEDKREVVGYALVPDRAILRASDSGNYKIFFSKDTVKRASHLYFKKLHNNNTTLDHSEKTNGVSVVESWIVEDEKNDKINKYGLNPIQGGWAVVMKVENDEVWKDVKAGKYLGLSIEGMFSNRRIANSKEEAKTEGEIILEKIIEILK